MNLDEFKALPVGSVIKIQHGYAAKKLKNGNWQLQDGYDMDAKPTFEEKYPTIWNEFDVLAASGLRTAGGLHRRIDSAEHITLVEAKAKKPRLADLEARVAKLEARLAPPPFVEVVVPAPVTEWVDGDIAICWKRALDAVGAHTNWLLTRKDGRWVFSGGTIAAAANSPEQGHEGYEWTAIRKGGVSL